MDSGWLIDVIEEVIEVIIVRTLIGTLINDRLTGCGRLIGVRLKFIHYIFLFTAKYLRVLKVLYKTKALVGEKEWYEHVLLNAQFC